MQLSNGSFILTLMVQERKQKNKPKRKYNNRTTTDYLFKGANDILGMNFSQDRGKQGEPED